MPRVYVEREEEALRLGGRSSGPVNLLSIHLG